MKELIYTNFRLTRAPGGPTMVLIDGVLVEMRKCGAAPAPAKAKSTKPRRPRKNGTKPKPSEPSVKASKPAAARRTEAVPQ